MPKGRSLPMGEIDCFLEARAAKPSSPRVRMPLRSEEKDRLKRRKDRLQLRRDLHRLKLLQLFGVEDGRELREESLLRLDDLLLDGVDLYDHSSDLSGAPAGIQQNAQPLRQSLQGLHQQRKDRLACLQKLAQFGDLCRLQLQKLCHNLQWSQVSVALWNDRGLQLQDLVHS